MTAAPILLAPSTLASESLSPRYRAEPPFLLTAGAEIYAQGERARGLYRVEFGAVRLYRLLADGRRQISSFYLPGEIFGFEIGETHHFFAEAVCTTGLRALPRARGAELDAEIMGSALRCLVRSQEHLLVVGRQNAIERVATFLVDMAERQGGLDQVDLPMSRADIGDYLGLTIETVSRIISKLRSQGIVRLRSLRTLQILKPSALKTMAS